MIPQQWSRTVLGAIIGGIAIGLVTALLTAAVYSYNAASKANDLAQEFKSASQQLEDLQENDVAATLRSERATKGREEQNRILMAQNATLQRQIAALVSYLRKHGIEVPVPEPAPPAPKPVKPSKPRPPKPPKQPPKPTPAPAVPDGCLFPPPFCFSLDLSKVVLLP